MKMETETSPANPFQCLSPFTIKAVFSRVHEEFGVFQSVATASCPDSGHLWEEPEPSFLTAPMEQKPTLVRSALRLLQAKEFQVSGPCWGALWPKLLTINRTEINHQLNFESVFKYLWNQAQGLPKSKPLSESRVFLMRKQIIPYPKNAVILKKI